MSGLLSLNFDHKDVPLEFFAINLAAVSGGLVLGASVDTCFRKLQKDGAWQERRAGKAAAFFALQATANILFFLILVRSLSFFLPWLQLSMSGALFSVLFFAGQRNLIDNALRITNF